jgi:hypothetical protein
MAQHWATHLDLTVARAARGMQIVTQSLHNRQPMDIWLVAGATAERKVLAKNDNGRSGMRIALIPNYELCIGAAGPHLRSGGRNCASA